LTNIATQASGRSKPEKQAQATNAGRNNAAPMRPRKPFLGTRQAAQGQALGGGDGEATQPTAANAKLEMSDAPAPMKQEQPERNPAANGGRKAGRLGGGDPNNVSTCDCRRQQKPAARGGELGMAKVTRAIYSERQLQQVNGRFLV